MKQFETMISFKNKYTQWVSPLTCGIAAALIGLTTGSGAIFLYYYGLRHVKASLSTFLELMYPITAVVLDYFVNGTKYSPVQWIAAFVMLFAIVMLNVDRKSK